MGIINRYKMKDGITKEDIVAELKEKRIPLSKYGTFISRDSVRSINKTLISDISVNIGFPADISTWDDFTHVLVLDESFGQPYTPFYSIMSDERKPFPFVLNTIGHYNRFMDSLNFLERKEGDNNEG